MSWLTLAKTALKEAQKQIDKALDIQEVDEQEWPSDAKTSQTQTPTPSADETTTSSAVEIETDEREQTPTADPDPEEKKQDETTSASPIECRESSSCSGVLVDSTAPCSDDPQAELQTLDSDSTHSFEDIQMLSSRTEGVNFLQDTLIDDDKKDASPLASNDEMDTNASSDIEIISNPNGDSSSTSTTRTSPQQSKRNPSDSGIVGPTTKATSKGHCREPSEISIISEDSQTEVDKLMQRISELSEVVESRELRLLQSEQQNAMLQERNSQLQGLMDKLKTNSGTDASTEEYTKRVSALEKKFQSSLRERDALQIQMKSLKDELRNKIPKEELDSIVSKDSAMIAELRLEGEKLSKEILQQSNIIKRLRNKEKSSEALLKKNKDQIADLTDELERLKKTLHAKEEVERTQIEVVHKLSSEKRRLEEQDAQNKSLNEDLQTKLSTAQTNLNAVKAELLQRAQMNTDITRTAEEVSAARKENETISAQNRELIAQLNELREKLRLSDYEMARKEKMLRDENKELLRRLEEAELRAEGNAQEINLTTIPLMRQLESLQNTLTQRTNNWNSSEKALLEKLENSQRRLKSLETVEQAYEEKMDLIEKHCQELEDKLSERLMAEERSKIMLQQAELKHSSKETDLNMQLILLQEELNTVRNASKAAEEERERAAKAAESEMNAQLLDRSQSPVISNDDGNCNYESGFDWHTDDIEPPTHLRRASDIVPEVLMNLGGHNTSTLEHLHSLLKQRDGELSQLQWEMTRLHTERNILNEEITNLTYELEIAKEKMLATEHLEKSHNDLQERYDALLQMYGEKVERTEELQLDLTELKDAYKKQINELLAQPPNTS